MDPSAPITDDAFADLPAETLDRTRRLAQETNTAHSAVLARLGVLSEAAIADRLARHLQLPLLRRVQLIPDPGMAAELSVDYCRRRKVMPVRASIDGLSMLAMADPCDEATYTAMNFAYGLPLRKAVSTETDIADAWEGFTATPHALAPDAFAGSDDLLDDAALLADHASDAPVIRLVARTLTKAASLRASDIHFEPGDETLEVRFRVDGALGVADTLPRRWAEPVVSRLKLMAGLDIAEKRLPQDGRIRTAAQGVPLDLRLATFPTLHGESAVVRLLGQQEVILDLGRIGLSAEGEVALRTALAKPHGLVLITGPTGSGKTTTLYAALHHLRRPESKIVTVEDPVEYTLPGTAQMQVRPEIGLDFAQALRSVLRHDPDVIMVGEIRDRETADIAIRASLTGHLVLATLHTNTAAGAVTRLLDLGVQDFLLASTLALTSAQRLVRRVCPGCRRQRAPRPDEMAAFRAAGLLYASSSPGLQVSEAVGCDACLQRGFLGRTPLFEALPLGGGLSVRVRMGFDEAAFDRAARDLGHPGLVTHGLRKVLAGETTFDEVIAATGHAGA